MKVYKIFAIINVLLIAYNFCNYLYLKNNLLKLRLKGSNLEYIYALFNFIILIISVIMIILFILNI